MNSVQKPILIPKAIVVFFRGGVQAVKDKIKTKYTVERSLKISEQYKDWFKKNFPLQDELDSQRKQYKNLKYKPKISIITPVYNTPFKVLSECIESVLNQSYQNWELCLADDASTNEDTKEVLQSFAQRDDRIKLVFRKKNAHISQASNTALELAGGDFIGLLDHDDFLWPNALFEVVKVLNKNREAEFIYSDEDKLDENGKTHSEPFFKPDWSTNYLRSVNYITHFTVIRKSLVSEIGGFRLGYEGAQDWDLFLRATRELESGSSNQKQKKIVHIPTILYSWRKSEESTSSEKTVGKVKSYAETSQKKALEDDLKERKLLGEVTKVGEVGYWRTKYEIVGVPKVSIVIPTKDKFPYVSKCLNSVLKLTTYKNFELVIVDTGSNDARLTKLYNETKTKWPATKLLNWRGEFNFSEVCNFGVENSSGDYILLLNNDTEIISKDWIEGLLEHAQRKEIGAVGCKLLYTNKTIQHAGIILGIKGGRTDKGIAGHAFKYFPQDFAERGVVETVKDYSAVTAACLMVSKEKYLEVGGLDRDFKIAFNDVDFNLKLLRKGYYNVYTGFVTLYHHESISVEKPGSVNRKLDVLEAEIKEMHLRWGNLLQNDPFYNVNLTLDHEDFTLR